MFQGLRVYIYGLGTTTPLQTVQLPSGHTVLGVFNVYKGIFINVLVDNESEKKPVRFFVFETSQKMGKAP